jgi:hypothetical protein
VDVVLVLICVALCVDSHRALRMGAASRAMNYLPPRDRGEGCHSQLVCGGRDVVRRASARRAQMVDHVKSHA